MSDHLVVYTVYHDPSDYPGRYVTRRSVVHYGGTFDGTVVPDAAPTVVCDTIEEARKVPEGKGLARMERDPIDEPCIVEVWI